MLIYRRSGRICDLEKPLRVSTRPPSFGLGPTAETAVKKVIVFGLLLVACHRTSPNTKPDPNVLGAATPRAAVSAYLNAIIAQDLQAMSAVFGTEEGSVRKSKPADEIMKSDVVIVTAMKCIQPDYTVVSE